MPLCDQENSRKVAFEVATQTYCLASWDRRNIVERSMPQPRCRLVLIMDIDTSLERKPDNAQDWSCRLKLLLFLGTKLTFMKDDSLDGRS